MLYNVAPGSKPALVRHKAECACDLSVKVMCYGLLVIAGVRFLTRIIAILSNGEFEAHFLEII